MNTELEMVKKLYELSKNSKMTTPPKQTLMSWKCPKCNLKLKKKSVKVPLYAEEGGKEFSNIVCNDHGVPSGLYNISMDHFTCTCSYEYIGVKLDKVEM